MRTISLPFIPDENLEALAEFYTSEFVANNMPWIRRIPFAEWVTRVFAEKGLILQ